MVEILAMFENIQADCTFSMVPAPFYQLLTINFVVERNGVKKLFVGIYFLLTNKTQELYTRVLAWLKAFVSRTFVAITTLAWRKLMIDFEKVLSFCILF